MTCDVAAGSPTAVIKTDVTEKRVSAQRAALHVPAAARRDKHVTDFLSGPNDPLIDSLLSFVFNLNFT